MITHTYTNPELNDDMAMETGPAVYLDADEVTLIEARRLAEEARGIFPESAKMWHLSEENFCVIAGMAVAGKSLEAMQRVFEDRLQLPPGKAPSRMCFSRFRADFLPFWHVARRRKNRGMLELLGREAEEAPLDFNNVLRDQMKQLAWEMLTTANPTQKSVQWIMKLVLKMRDQELMAKRMAIQLHKLDAELALKRAHEERAAAKAAAVTATAAANAAAPQPAAAKPATTDRAPDTSAEASQTAEPDADIEPGKQDQSRPFNFAAILKTCTANLDALPEGFKI